MTELKADPSLGTTGLGGAIRSMVDTINDNAFFAPLKALFANTTSRAEGADPKDIYVTTDVPISGPPVKEAMYNWHYNTNGMTDAPRDWSSAIGTGSAQDAAAQGIAVLKVDPTRWSLESPTSPESAANQWSRLWPAVNDDGNGQFIKISVGRMMVHELAHGITDPTANAFADIVGAERFNYNEEVAAFAENIYYVGYAKSYNAANPTGPQIKDTFLSMGHEAPYGNNGQFPTVTGGAADNAGATGTLYFDEGSIPSISVNRTSGNVSFYDWYLPEGGSITKTYYDASTKIHHTEYSRLVTVDYVNYNGIMSIDSNGHASVADRITQKIIPESAASDPSAALQSVASVKHFFDILSDKQYGDVNAATNSGGTRDVLHYSDIDEIRDIINPDQMRILTIGADRYFGDNNSYAPATPGGPIPTPDPTKAIDVSGPTQKGTHDNPDEIAIDDQMQSYWDEWSGEEYIYDQSLGTVIVGASGVGKAGDKLDTRDSHDYIMAGTGDDIVIGGKNTSTVGNYLNGGFGSDTIVEGTGHDKMYGGQGLDLFIMSKHKIDATGSTVDGGAGFDIVSYLETGGVTYNQATGKASHDGRVDTLTSVGIIVGSDNASQVDNFSGSDMIFAGGKGNDVFHLGNHATAIGGDGNDDFHIAINTTGTTNYLLIDFEAGDELFLGGSTTAHKGSTRTVIENAGPDGRDTQYTFTSGGAANPYADSYFASQEYSGSYWTEELHYGGYGHSNPDAELTSLLSIQHHVNGAVVSTTNIYMTSFNPGDGGLNYNHYEQQYESPISIGSMFQYGIPESTYGIF